MTVSVTLSWEDVVAAAADHGMMITPMEAEQWLKKNENDLREEMASCASDWMFFKMCM